MQIVWRPSRGMKTASICAGLDAVSPFGPPIENKYRMDPSTDAKRRRMRGSVMRASRDSRSRNAAGRFVIAAKSNRRSL